MRASSYVIIGSGISGALAAFELIEKGVAGEKIVIFEAREAVSRESSRNAGHVRTDAFREFRHYSSLHGSAQALKILTNEHLVLKTVDELVKKHDIDCDFILTTTFDVCMTPEHAEYEREAFEAMEIAGGDVSHIKFLSGRSTIEAAAAAYEQPAGSSHPAKLAQWLMNSVIQKGCKLFTHCPVSKVALAVNAESSWDLVTPGGNTTTPKVVHCTNAYASFLLPLLGSYLTPNRTQAHSLIAGSALSGNQRRQSTYSLRYTLEHFYSLNQRRGVGTLILGVSRRNPILSLETRKSYVTFEDNTFVLDLEATE